MCSRTPIFTRLKKEAERQRKQRSNLKRGIEEVCEKDAEAASVLKSFNRGVTGKPRLEVDQPELLSAIVKIVTNSSATDDRRRSEMLRSVTTLDDLTGKLKEMGLF